jgi:hypothetical protein
MEKNALSGRPDERVSGSRAMCMVNRDSLRLAFEVSAFRTPKVKRTRACLPELTLARAAQSTLQGWDLSVNSSSHLLRRGVGVSAFAVLRQREFDECLHLGRLLPPAGVVEVEAGNVGEKLLRTRFNFLARM